jgi:hypothetical protein
VRALSALIVLLVLGAASIDAQWGLRLRMVKRPVATPEGRQDCGVNVMAMGVPCPTFGLESTGLPTRPIPWTTTVTGAYYIDNSVTCTDTSNTYGHPNNPRCTMPTGASAIVPAGAYVEVRGGPYSPGSSTFTTNFGNCTQGAPCLWIGVGTAGTTNATITAGDFNGDYTLDVTPTGCNRTVQGVTGCVQITDRTWRTQGQYFVIEGFYLHAPTDNGATSPITGQSPDHYAFRAMELTAITKTTGSCISVGSSSYLVIARVNIHDCGDHSLAAGEEIDVHCIHGGGNGADHIWVLENKLYNCGGDGIQINSTQTVTDAAHNLYIGRSEIYQNGENALDWKTCYDVIVSENHMHTQNPAGAGSDETLVVVNDENHATGFRADHHLFFLFNVVHNGLGPGFRCQAYCYIFGNLVYDTTNCVVNYSSDSGTVYENNTCDNVDTTPGPYATGSLAYHGATGAVNIWAILTNNIFTLSETAGTDVDVQNATRDDAATAIHYNLFPDTGIVYKWGSSSSYATLALWEAAATPKASGNFTGDPDYANEAADDYRLQASSTLAIDTGTTPTIPAIFLARYGLNIQRDLRGVVRPRGAGWDLGAFEY